MNKKYKKENFESRDEALFWVADNKPIYRTGALNINTEDITIMEFSKTWKHWHKAIEIAPEKRLIEVWVNIYPDRLGCSHNSYGEAVFVGCEDSIGIVKLSKEITIIDGKVVEDEN